MRLDQSNIGDVLDCINIFTSAVFLSQIYGDINKKLFCNVNKPMDCNFVMLIKCNHFW